MALRQNEFKENNINDGRSAVAGLTPIGVTIKKRPTNVEWRKWSNLFVVAMTAKYSIYITEVLRVVANETHSNKAHLNNLDHAVAERKCVSVLYLSLGAAARKTFTDKNPTAKIAEISLQDLMTNCKDTFDKKRNRTLDRFRFLSRKHMQTETLEQF